MVALAALALEAVACATYVSWALYGRDPHDPLEHRLFPFVPEPVTRWSCGPLYRRFPDDPGNCYRAP